MAAAMLALASVPGAYSPSLHSDGIDPLVQQANRERKAAERAARAPWKLAAAEAKRARKRRRNLANA